MMHYDQESVESRQKEGKTPKSLVICGEDRIPSLAEIRGSLDKVRSGLNHSLWPSIDYAVSTESGTGAPERQNSGLYRVAFSEGSESGQIRDNSFFEGLCEYGFRLGRELDQDRVYVEFDGQRYVFKRSESETFEGEEALESESLVYLERGRPNWEVPHTIEVVDWMKKLVDAEGGNRRVLLTAGWLHDSGYAGLFDDQEATYENIGRAKPIHAENGPEIAGEILPRLNYPNNETERIKELIRKHDRLKELESPYEIMVMETDTLGQLSQPKERSTFNEEDYAKFIAYVRDKRAPMFRTATGIEALEDLLTNRH